MGGFLLFIGMLLYMSKKLLQADQYFFRGISKHVGGGNHPYQQFYVCMVIKINNLGINMDIKGDSYIQVQAQPIQ